MLLLVAFFLSQNRVKLCVIYERLRGRGKSLSPRCFSATDSNRKSAVFLFNLSSLYYISIVGIFSLEETKA